MWYKEISFQVLEGWTFFVNLLSTRSLKHWWNPSISWTSISSACWVKCQVISSHQTLRLIVNLMWFWWPLLMFSIAGSFYINSPLEGTSDSIPAQASFSQESLLKAPGKKHLSKILSLKFFQKKWMSSTAEVLDLEQIFLFIYNSKEWLSL